MEPRRLPDPSPADAGPASAVDPSTLATAPKLNRNLGLDLLRIYMAVMVVGLHTDWLYRVSPLWNQLTANGLFRAAVPVFFVINGYYAFDTFETGKARTWTSRILRIYVFWATVYLPAYWMTPGAGGSSLGSFAANVTLGYWHLWYMVALAIGGIFLYLLRAKPSSQLLSLAGVLFVSGVALEFAKLTGVIQIPSRLYRSGLFDALPFLIVGYLIRRDQFQISRRALLLLTLVGLIGLLFESFAEQKFVLSTIRPDLFLSMLVLCPAVFLLALKLPFRTTSDRYSKASSAIYFVHLGIVLIAERMGIPAGLQLFCIVLLLSALACWPLIAITRRLRLTFIL